MKNNPQRILTIPNILSCFRILLIPFIIWVYCAREHYLLASGIVLLSGISDTVDGFIARRFNMVTDIGKVLDPVADKLTQAAMIFCLIFRFRGMLYLLIMLIAKELIQGLMGLWVLRSTGNIYSAKWYGKLCTWVLYIVMMIHMLFPDIDPTLSGMLMLACAAAMLLSLVMYVLRYLTLLGRGPARPGKPGEGSD